MGPWQDFWVDTFHPLPLDAKADQLLLKLFCPRFGVDLTP